MKTVPGPRIVIKHKRKKGVTLYVPEGWKVLVPDVTSSEAPKEIVQGLFQSGYLRALRDAMARRAIDYATLFPELLEETTLPRTRRRVYRLRGFDPSELQATFVPFEHVAAQGKRSYMDEIFEMGLRARTLSAKEPDDGMHGT